jgi:hypothetical protein
LKNALVSELQEYGIVAETVLMWFVALFNRSYHISLSRSRVYKVPFLRQLYARIKFLLSAAEPFPAKRISTSVNWGSMFIQTAGYEFPTPINNLM